MDIDGTTVVCEVWESERLQPLTRRFSPAFLPNDRPHFANLSGNLEYASIEVAHLLPEGWAWAEPEWKIDSSWAPEDRTDAQGWSYAGTFGAFANGASTPSSAGLRLQGVRRRRWTRARVCVTDAAVQVVRERALRRLDLWEAGQKSLRQREAGHMTLQDFEAARRVRSTALLKEIEKKSVTFRSLSKHGRREVAELHWHLRQRGNLDLSYSKYLTQFADRAREASASVDALDASSEEWEHVDASPGDGDGSGGCPPPPAPATASPTRSESPCESGGRDSLSGEIVFDDDDGGGGGGDDGARVRLSSADSSDGVMVDTPKDEHPPTTILGRSQLHLCYARVSHLMSEFAHTVSREMVGEAKAVSEQFTQGADVVCGESNSLAEACRGTEMATRNAFDAYSAAYEGMLNRAKESLAEARGGGGGGGAVEEDPGEVAAAAGAGAKSPSDGTRDVWLAEQCYRDALSSVTAAASRAADRFPDLVARFDALEKRRASLVLSVRKVYLQQQAALWMDMHSIGMEAVTACSAEEREQFQSAGAECADESASKNGDEDGGDSKQEEGEVGEAGEGEEARQHQQVRDKFSALTEMNAIPAPGTLLVAKQGQLSQLTVVQQVAAGPVSGAPVPAEHRWQDAHAVLTRDHFLHCFGETSGGLSRPSLSIDLRGAACSECTEVDNAFQVVVQTRRGLMRTLGGMMKRGTFEQRSAQTFIFRTPAASEVDEWVGAVREPLRDFIANRSETSGVSSAEVLALLDDDDGEKGEARGGAAGEGGTDGVRQQVPPPSVEVEKEEVEVEEEEETVAVTGDDDGETLKDAAPAAATAAVAVADADTAVVSSAEDDDPFADIFGGEDAGAGSALGDNSRAEAILSADDSDEEEVQL